MGDNIVLGCHIKCTGDELHCVQDDDEPTHPAFGVRVAKAINAKSLFRQENVNSRVATERRTWILIFQTRKHQGIYLQNGKFIGFKILMHLDLLGLWFIGSSISVLSECDIESLFRVYLYLASALVLRQLYNDACDSVLIENYGVTPE